jgi:hypothetical protein
MTIESVRALVPIPDAELVPAPGLFAHQSTLHGQAHVARVMVHAFRLVEATGFVDEAPRLWAAVYLHDLARQHDGTCRRHGADAWARLATLPEVRALFARAGLTESDDPAIEAAVTVHSHGEPPAGHPHRRLMALLKDADGLDRVRLGDLDPRYFRHPQTSGMVGFARRLFEETDGRLAPGSGCWSRLWPIVERLLANE